MTSDGIPARYLSPPLTAAAVIIIIAGMMQASSIVTPILLALFISVICAQPVTWLARKKNPPRPRGRHRPGGDHYYFLRFGTGDRRLCGVVFTGCPEIRGQPEQDGRDGLSVSQSEGDNHHGRTADGTARSGQDHDLHRLRPRRTGRLDVEHGTDILHHHLHPPRIGKLLRQGPRHLPETGRDDWNIWAVSPRAFVTTWASRP